MQIYENYSLLKHNTFNLDVKTRWFIQYDSEEDLQLLLKDEYFFSQSFWHIGQGSNLLFLDDYNGIIIHSGIKGIDVIKEDEKSVWVKVGASEDWDCFVKYCVDQEWGGLENLSRIPGEVGASAFQNIGAYGVEAADHIAEVHTFFLETGEKRIFKNEECNYSYRSSFFKETKNRGLYYITYVVYKLDKKPVFKLNYGDINTLLKGKDITLQTIRNVIISIREAKLPDTKVFGNAGSFFMNPYIDNSRLNEIKQEYPTVPFYDCGNNKVKIPAAWLIEQCGWKGKALGNAAVHDKQPLVIINKGKATGEEIALLAEQIQSSVLNRFGIKLQPEVNYI